MHFSFRGVSELSGEIALARMCFRSTTKNNFCTTVFVELKLSVLDDKEKRNLTEMVYGFTQ